MKKRRTLIISLLLVAALMLGIGYAALSRELIINSTAILSADNNDFEIVFVDGSSSNAMATTSVPTPSRTVSYEVTGLSKKDESVTLTYTVENMTDDVKGKLISISPTDGDLYIGEGTSNKYSGPVSDYFTKVITVTLDKDPSVTYTYALGAAVPAEFILEPGDTATVTVTITLAQTITEDKISLTGASVMLTFHDVE